MIHLYCTGREARTPDTWFWRPVLYQLSYSRLFAAAKVELFLQSCNNIPEKSLTLRKKKRTTTICPATTPTDIRDMKVLFLFIIILALNGCAQQDGRKRSTIFGQEERQIELYDLPEIQHTGTLIGITLNGPDTYYEYRGEGMGEQYLLAKEFARHIGAKLQMETAADTTTLLQKLACGEADFIALEMGEEKRWMTRENTPLLAQCINEWWNPSRKLSLQKQTTGKNTIKRKMRPAMYDRANGIISAFDEHLTKGAEMIGWDWRLLAAQCYQESGFDPQAESWAGAKGLMQIMPATANEMGISTQQLYDPATNIHTAARYLKQLNRTFSDIKDKRERIKFVLAAYNGGALHIRDAMTLARKYGGNERLWSDVAGYVLKLSDPKYYRDPVVKNGYMRGSETEAYVRQILDRWFQYQGCARAHSKGSSPKPAKRNMKDGKHQSNVKSAEEFLE